MIDLHCHILPGIDDGPETLGEAVEMCRIAADDGITTIVATPHFRPGKYDNLDIADRLTRLRSEIARQGIAVEVLSGADVTVTPELPFYLAQNPQLTVNGTGKYFLAELPHDAVPARWEEFLLSFRGRGITPIITHPERNHWFISHPDALRPFVLAGGLVQITAMSILGKNGVESRNYSRYLLRRSLVHVIATDAHSIDQRPPRLAEAVRAAGTIIGEAQALRLVRDTPQGIIAGRSVDVQQAAAEGPTKRKWYRRMLDL